MTEEASNTRTILIIDDDERFLKLFTRFLEAENLYTIVTESHTANILEMARFHKPDLVLLDLIMPERGGEDIINDFRKDPLLKNTRVIFLTGILGASETKNSIKTIGSCEFLAKSTPRDIMLKLIREEVYGYEGVPAPAPQQ
jgi:ActR/RegA family two-component response regulator